MFFLWEYMRTQIIWLSDSTETTHKPYDLKNIRFFE